MSRFRRREYEFEAKQYNGPNYLTADQPIPKDIHPAIKWSEANDFRYPYVTNLLGDALFVNPGDFILPETDGKSYYIMTPQEFYKHYEKVN